MALTYQETRRKGAVANIARLNDVITHTPSAVAALTPLSTALEADGVTPTPEAAFFLKQIQRLESAAVTAANKIPQIESYITDLDD